MCTLKTGPSMHPPLTLRHCLLLISGSGHWEQGQNYQLLFCKVEKKCPHCHLSTQYCRISHWKVTQHRVYWSVCDIAAHAFLVSWKQGTDVGAVATEDLLWQCFLESGNIRLLLYIIQFHLYECSINNLPLSHPLHKDRGLRFKAIKWQIQT